MKFVSSVSVVVRSGKGGNGIIAWRRESRVRLGGPDGGSGGDGGSVYIEADENINSLFHLRHIKFLSAKDGESGQNKSRKGRNAEDVVLKVPCGTSIWDKQKKVKLFDLVRHGSKYLVCKGGIGGRGNCEFKSSRMTAPYLYEFGDPSEEKEIFLNLESIADVGFLGKPNAGKSSLLSLISNAKPKISEIPFTTLIPVLGMVFHKDSRLIFADIPGLIENASRGSGLGIEFLKHINRCKILVHLVDVSSDNVCEDIEIVEREISNYSLDLLNKTRLLVFNKLDLISNHKLDLICEKFQHLNPIFISAKNNLNIDMFLDRVFSVYSDIPRIGIDDELEYLEFRDDESLFAKLEILNEKNKWIVTHPYLKYWVNKIPKDTRDNIARWNQKIEKYEVNKELFKRGAVKGDLVCIYDWEYEFWGE